jgi:hypothetical protein
MPFLPVDGASENEAIGRFSKALYLPMKIEFVWQLYATFSAFFA